MHEDEDLLIIDKPPGLLTVNLDQDSRPSVFGVLKERARADRRRRGDRRIWVIHRLDKEASGLLVFAKTTRAFEVLKEEFRSKRVHRLYTAVVEGEVPPVDGKPASGTVQSFIAEDDSGTMRSVGFGESTKERHRRPPSHSSRSPRDPGATPKLAVTHYRVLGAGHGRSLVQLRLETGRKNQIRVHMSEWGHPLVGDARFGASTDPIRRVTLHASELGFTHPATGQTVRFSSPAPAGFYRLVGMTRQGQPEAEPPANAPPAAPAVSPPRKGDTSWDHVAGWYDELLEEQKSDHYEQVILPGTLRLLRPRAGMRVLDVACGQGVLTRRLAGLGVDVLGVDAAPRLIEAARRRAGEEGEAAAKMRFEVGDARNLNELTGSLSPPFAPPFDAVSCVMALMNIEPLEPVMRGCAAMLRPGGAFVAVILHPAFRSPGQTAWGWDRGEGASHGRGERGPGRAPRSPRQYRRIDGYLSPGQRQITMNPGFAAHGAEAVTTWTFHRPIQTYVRHLAQAGFLIESIEEWPSVRRSQPGPRAAEENRARREIPLFLALRAVKTPRPEAEDRGELEEPPATQKLTATEAPATPQEPATPDEPGAPEEPVTR